MRKGLFIVFIISMVIPLAGAAADPGKVADINGTKLYVKEIGKGEPVIVIHGGPGLFHDYFLPHMEKLAKNRKLIFFDQRGNGRSEVPLNSGTYTLKNLVDDIEGIRKYYKLEKVNLLGHSFGGFLAMHYAVKYPEHMKSLVLMNTAPASSDLMMQAILNKQSRYSKEDTAALGKLMTDPRFMKGDPEVVGKFFRIAEKFSVSDSKFLDEVFSVPFTENTARNMLMINQLSRQIFADYDIHDLLPGIPCPTLIVHGLNDFIPLESSKKIQRAVKGSELAVIKNCAHYPFIETPEQLFPLLEDFYTEIQVKR